MVYNHGKPGAIGGHWCGEVISPHFETTNMLISHHNTRVGDCSLASHLAPNRYFSNLPNIVVVAMK
eukprot:scaffold21205_cov94-Skeletonema_dohrnii-CCMP3373.AAC.1